MYLAGGNLKIFEPASSFPELKEGNLLSLVERWAASSQEAYTNSYHHIWLSVPTLQLLTDVHKYCSNISYFWFWAMQLTAQATLKTKNMNSDDLFTQGLEICHVDTTVQYLMCKFEVWPSLWQYESKCSQDIFKVWHWFQNKLALHFKQTWWQGYTHFEAAGVLKLESDN